MLQLLIALLLGFSSPKSTTDEHRNVVVSASASNDTIGEGGQIPPKKPNKPAK
ncbi:hypothetical protein H9X96_12655 [Pedobacter sp. N36a]|uniref:hypothetical protein n=1 Tax=Pedobacter sp. N36a TaxID=2767996 RepID=UPI0016569D2C|nr:hypothetical protein [Pedobacter sp. N36a]MBC8986630.1 hypothetical protein [Pedobacter sp. N36a]